MHRAYWSQELTLREVGEQYGMAGETVRRLFVRYNLPRQSRGHISSKAVKDREQLRTQVLVTYRRLGSIQQVCQRIGRSRRFVSGILASSDPSDVRPSFGRLQIKNHLKEAAHHGRLSISAYVKYQAQNPATRPTVSEIVFEYTSWEKALTLARVCPEKAPSGAVISDKACLQAIKRCTVQKPAGPSARQYAEWTIYNDAPSVATISARFGSWSNAVQAARAF